MLTKQPDLLDKFQSINQATSNEDRIYRQQQGLKALNALLQREYAHELKEYKVHKKIANVMCDLGFVISENPTSSGLDKYHRLVKQTEKHMIVVTY